jgi:uncharacterized membrane protein YkoI
LTSIWVGAVSDYQRGVLALRKREILATQTSDVAAQSAPAEDAATTITTAVPNASAPQPAPMKSRDDLAKAARLSSSQVVMIEKIQKQAAPEVVAAVKSGVISINAAAAVATLPEHEQIAAAQGGKALLQQAAKRVRETKKRATPVSDAPVEAAALDETSALRARIVELEAENSRLRQQLAAFGPLGA